MGFANLWGLVYKYSKARDEKKKTQFARVEIKLNDS